MCDAGRFRERTYHDVLPERNFTIRRRGPYKRNSISLFQKEKFVGHLLDSDLQLRTTAFLVTYRSKEQLVSRIDLFQDSWQVNLYELLDVRFPEKN